MLAPPPATVEAKVPSIRPPARPEAPLDTVASVLVIETLEWQMKVRAALPADRFELVTARDVEEGLRLARSTAPDVVLADLELIEGPALDFMGRLRSDPLTGFVPVVLLLPAGTPEGAEAEHGADHGVAKPFEGDVLSDLVGRLAQPGDYRTLDDLGALTSAQVADRVAAEVRRGLVDSVATGRDTKVAMGNGAEVLAAAWAAVARVRAQIAQRSAGRVTFRDSPTRGGPSLMALVEQAGEAADLSEEVPLVGRRIVVADDDPAVVWFFAGLLREEGAVVFEASDGREALDEARRRRPDLIISDILMPNLDGFGLCRAMSREPALSDVPIILLSWKEDYLQRMRELQAGASGYLRKEEGAPRILEQVRKALLPQARLEAQLLAGAEVRGRLEAVGMPRLLRGVATKRPNARITVRDAWSLFEVDLRMGNVVQVTRTATDGSFARGPRTLLSLLGTTSGRYTVVLAEASIKGTIDTSLDETLAEGAMRLKAVLDAVTGAGMSLAAEVHFDEDVMASFLATSPEPVRVLVERLQSGQGPRDLLLAPGVSPEVLEPTLRDLARRGAILEVIGLQGEDRIKQSLRASQPRLLPLDEEVTDPLGETGEELPGLDAPFTAKDPAASVPPPPMEEPQQEDTYMDPDEAARLLGDAGRSKRTTEPDLAELLEPGASGDAIPSPGPGLAGAGAVARPRMARRVALYGLLAVALGVGGFLGWRAFERMQRLAGEEPADLATDAPAPAAPDAGVVQVPAPEPELAYGETRPYIDAGTMLVGNNEGLLLVRSGEDGSSVHVHLGDRDLGTPPVRLSLPEGMHTFVFRDGTRESYRHVYVRRGQTRIVQAP